MNSDNFFRLAYTSLRPGKGHFPWMKELYHRTIRGCPPRLIDLPTGSGKTDVAVVWLIALAFFGLHRDTCSPVPRRLVWVVNRRVLVAQIYRLVRQIQHTISAANRAESIAQVVSGLRNLAKNETRDDTPIQIVQLRGQVVDDREWAADPSRPAIIIGTVDQIGSRLLFQGYGVGRRDRPLQASLLGVDAWVCVDEAHLVPAFILTLRQLAERITAAAGLIPSKLSGLFAQLPWHFSELSATPGLPQPEPERALTLSVEDRQNKLLAMRIQGAARRKVEVIDCSTSGLLNKIGHHLGEKTRKDAERAVRDGTTFSKKLVEEIRKAVPESDARLVAEYSQGMVERIASAAAELRDHRLCVAIYVHTPAEAHNIGDSLGKKLKLGEKAEARILTITGRLRGVERDRLNRNEVFQAFNPERRQPDATGADRFGFPASTVYLIGTAAAEVGMDTDADIILCDAAPLDTLVQRLGRLDRLGVLIHGGRRVVMRIFSNQNAASPSCLSLAEQISKKIAKEIYAPSAALLAANAWCMGHQNDEQETEEEGAKTKGDKKEKPPEQLEIIDAATAKVIVDEPSPACWRCHPLAHATIAPVLCQPLTAPILEFWTATTERPRPELPVHPWLYGLATDDSATALVGLVFRLELDALAQIPVPQESIDPDEETGSEAAKLRQSLQEVFRRCPPAKSEAHWVPLHLVRKWFAPTPAKGETPPEAPTVLAFHDEARWAFIDTRDFQQQNGLSVLASRVMPEDLFILPTSAGLPDFMKEEIRAERRAIADVAALAYSATDCAPWRRTIHTPEESNAQDLHGWLRADEDRTGKGIELIESDSGKPPQGNHKPFKTLHLRISGCDFEFAYTLAPRFADQAQQYLDDHHAAADCHARSLLKSVAPADPFLETFYAGMARVHDAGKNWPPDRPHWQIAVFNAPNRAVGWQPLAKTDRFVHPSRFKGYRHEWGSLQMDTVRHVLDDSLKQLDEPGESEFFAELFHHLVGAHHGCLRPSLPDQPGIQRSLLDQERLIAAVRWHHLQTALGPWRLAYLETLLKSADTLASRDAQVDEDEE